MDDGYPEAEEYETNYVSYNMREPGSYNRAAETANNMLAASRVSDTMVFRPIALDSRFESRRPRSYRRSRVPMRFNRIRDSLTRLIRN